MKDKDRQEKIQEILKKWREGPFAKFQQRGWNEAYTSYREPVKEVYTPLDFSDDKFLEKTGFPGEYPFVRGVYPTMYRGRPWTMRQYAGFASAEESNRRYRYLLDQGQTGLSVAFDLPTQIGLDSDHILADGEVGKVGVPIDSLADMEVLFDQIPLDKVSTSMTINSPAAVLLAMYIALAEKQGVSADKLKGTIQNDILKEYFARGTYIFPPAPSLRLITDIFAFCSKELPNWNTISISGYHIREAGANAVQELAFTLADGIAYVEAALEAGLKIDEFAPRLSFFFNAQMNLLEEVAKFRAARRLWAKIMEEKFGAENPKSKMLRFHTQTAGASLTAQQAQNNIVRVTIQALAAVLGGTQSLHTNSYDEAWALPSEESVRIALRTQQIIAHESGATSTVDPLGGSYYLESLTEDMEKRVEEYLEKIEEMGGMVKAIEKGYVQREIQKNAYEMQKRIEKEEDIVVGVNKFAQEEEPPADLLEVDPQMEKEQIKKLKDVKQNRDEEKVKKSLEQMKKTAEENENLMPAIVEAVKAYATLGEICGVLRSIYGEYQAPTF